MAADLKAMSQTEISISAGSTATFPTSASCEDAAGRTSTARDEIGSSSLSLNNILSLIQLPLRE